MSETTAVPTSASFNPSAHQALYGVLVAIFITSLLVANLMGSLLLEVPLPWLAPGKTQLISAGIIAFPVTFLLTDLINEFYGAKGARQVTLMGFGMALLSALYFWLGNQLPVSGQSPLSLGVYKQVSGQFTGMLVASLSAYLVGQFLDIYLFGVFKSLTNKLSVRFTPNSKGQHRWLWVRATGSTVVSQLVDSFLVVWVAFGSQLPAATIWAVGTGNYWVKLAVALGITPLLYLGHFALKRFMQREAIDAE